ncbi:iron ABC transporter permease [Aminobacter aminovorans]|uniref:FecCD family ABC transporter permease n=1 Tax=Aminobacter aminovorans TaxID=83263 RepID=UPI00285A3E1D|nr:iron ABC transporter permease [Aminobacter aminovorans]MDR7223995.1 iron complex transport system permease protein [Aminobacter aminovorans]
MNRLPFWPTAAITFCALVAFALLATLNGAADLGLRQGLDALFLGAGDNAGILWDIRLPRVAIGILVGIHLAISGHLLQSATRNPLTDPNVLGIAGGAMLAVMIFLLITVYWGQTDGSKLTSYPLAPLPFVALFGGLVAASLTYLIAWRAGVTPLRLVLAGIAIGITFQALGLGIFAAWGSTRMETVLLWLSGSLYARGWEHALHLLPWTIAGLLVLPVMVAKLDLLSIGDDAAATLGVNVGAIRFSAIALATVLASSAVAIVGPLGFVGLITPHAARRLVGSALAKSLPISALLGALLVTLGDLIGRIAMPPAEIPVGAVTALIGVPVFLMLLGRRT